MGATLDDAAPIHDQNLVGIGDGRESVGDGECGSICSILVINLLSVCFINCSLCQIDELFSEKPFCLALGHPIKWLTPLLIEHFILKLFLT